MPLSRGELVMTAILLAVAVFCFAQFVDRSDSPLFLLALPIAVGAMAFGTRGGLAIAALASVLALVWWVANGEPGGASWPTSRILTSLFVGALLGRFVDSREKLRGRLAWRNALSSDLIATATFDGYLTEVNPAFTHVLGYTAHELTTRPFTDFIHPDDLEATLAVIAEQTEADRPVLNFVNRYRCKDGSYRWLEWASQPIPGTKELAAVARDITDRKRLEELAHRHTELLEDAVLRRTEELERRNEELDEARRETIDRLALAAEYRDDATQEHARRIGDSASKLAKVLGLADSELPVLRDAASLHDIGKVSVSDAVLLKPAKLTFVEREQMKRHAEKGAWILSGSRSEVLRVAEAVAGGHHEWWDGTGYPNGLRGEEIPLSARIVAVADVFDALTHVRPYKDAWTVEQAVDELHRLRGRQFDPEVVDAFDRLDPVELAGFPQTLPVETSSSHAAA